MKKLFIVIAELLAISLFVVAAFYAPQIIFQVQDTLICSKTELSKREKIDAEALSTTYEKSLCQRMQNFADGLEAGDSFYVTSQELALNQEIYDFLNSGSGIYQGLLSDFISIGLLSNSFVDSLWSENYTVSQWTQYVIYSDNYAKGVNFILWYIELQDEDNEILKLLMDAETSTLYAMKTENTSKIRIKTHMISNYFHADFWRESSLPSTWWAFASYYEIPKEEVYLEAYKYAMEEGYLDAHKYAMEEGYGFPWEYDAGQAEGYTGQAGLYQDVIIEELVNIYALASDKYKLEENIMRFQLPYGETSLEVLLGIEEGYDWDLDWYHGFPDVIFGVRQIYEMIPEFA